MAFLQFFGILIVVSSAIWTLFDAAKLRDEHQLGIGPLDRSPENWAAMVCLACPFVLPWYLRIRPEAMLAPRREGPPPRFVTQGMAPFGIWLAAVGVGLAAGLWALGRSEWMAWGVVVAGLGIFGGRRTHVSAGREEFGLGKAGFEQIGFRPPEDHYPDDDDDEMPVLNLDRARPPSSFVASAVPSAARDVISRPPRSTRDASPPSAPVRPTESSPGAGNVSVVDVLSAPPSASSPAPPSVSPAPGQPLGGQPLGTDPRATVVISDPELLAETYAQAAEAIGRAQPPVSPATAAAPPVPSPGASAHPPRPPSSRSSMPASGVAYAASASSRSRLTWPLWLLAALLLVAGGWWGFRQWSSTTGAIGTTTGTVATEPEGAVQADSAEVAPQEAVSAPAPVSAPPPAAPPAPPSAADAEKAMTEWLQRYSEIMTPLAGDLEEIDFDGFSPQSCRQLSNRVKQADRRLAESPDSDIESLIRPAIDSLQQAARGCLDEDEVAWSFNLIEAKKNTHAAQELMDQRFGFSGILELELESAIGEVRSEESISGRFLAGSLMLHPGDDEEGDEFGLDEF